ncbi:MAG: hypothetical protein ACRD2E_07300 [Terriglobales bacterium]
MIRKSLLAGLILLVGLAFTRPAAAQNVQSVTFFGGALLGSPNGFGAGAGLGISVTHNVSFQPTFLVGRQGGVGIFTLDGSFLYHFHISNSRLVPYLLGGVGLAEYGNSTHGSPIVGGGIEFPVRDGWQIRPEVRLATHGLSRFSIGLTKTF